MDVSENSDTPKSSILIGFSILWTIKPSILGVFPLFLVQHPYIAVMVQWGSLDKLQALGLRWSCRASSKCWSLTHNHVLCLYTQNTQDDWHRNVRVLATWNWWWTFFFNDSANIPQNVKHKFQIGRAKSGQKLASNFPTVRIAEFPTLELPLSCTGTPSPPWPLQYGQCGGAILSVD